MLDVLPYLF